jgi:hypothetical protein
MGIGDECPARLQAAKPFPDASPIVRQDEYW